MKIAIIGAGNMGSAIARGLALGNMGQRNEVIVSNPSEDKLENLKKDFPNIRTTHDNIEATTNADIVIVAVKPWLMEEILEPLRLKRTQILVSLAAGICFDDLAHYCGEPEMTIFRVIPNTAIAERASMTLMSARNASEKQQQLLMDIFNEMGLTMMIQESKIAAATALTSCGIAYVLKYVQAAMQAGIEMGIAPKDGIEMIAQSLEGAAKLLLNNESHPSVEIDKVTTPGGITIKGINELEHSGFTSAVIKAMKASKQ